MHERAHHSGHSPTVDAPEQEDPRRWRTLLVLCVVQFMVVLDVTVVNVALPSIGTDLALPRTTLPWVVSAYTLVFGGLLLLGGRLSDAIGRRQTFLIGLAVFTAASLTCGLAETGAVLIGARLVQGLGAALVSPSALAIISTTFSGDERNRALGVWGAIGGTGSVFGVLLGGVLTAGPGWPWAFFINVPIGIAVLAAALVVVPDQDSQVRNGRLDIGGAITMTAASGLLIFGLVSAGVRGWTAATTLLAIALGLGFAAVFVAIERVVSNPLVPLSVLRQRSVLGGNLAMLGAAGLLIAGFFLSSVYLQHITGYSALRTGLLFLPVALLMIVGAQAAGHLIGHAGWRTVSLVGFGLAAVGYVVVSLVPEGSSPLLKVLPGFMVAGAGLACMFVVATTSAMNEVVHERAGLVSGVVSTCHELGASLGVAFIAAVAGASLDVTKVAPHAAAGFDRAFFATGIAAVIVAAAVFAMLPAGRPRPGTVRFGH